MKTRGGLFTQERLPRNLIGGVLLLLTAALYLQMRQDAKNLMQQGINARKNHDYDTAIADYTQAIGLVPKSSTAYSNRAIAYEDKGDHKDAITDLKQAVDIDPTMVSAYVNLAWLLATCSQADLRDGRKAVEFATKACELTRWQNRPALEALAAACAEVGDFDNAVKWENEYLATADLNAKATANAKSRLELY